MTTTTYQRGEITLPRFHNHPAGTLCCPDCGPSPETILRDDLDRANGHTNGYTRHAMSCPICGLAVLLASDDRGDSWWVIQIDRATR